MRNYAVMAWAVERKYSDNTKNSVTVTQLRLHDSVIATFQTTTDEKLSIIVI